MINLNSAWAHLDALAKPHRSLGKLEELAARLASIAHTLKPAVRPRRLVLFAADHGVVARGVSAWPSEVTGLMVSTILAGRATSSALAATHACSVRLIDVGVASPPPQTPPSFFRSARIASGTMDLSTGPAMTLTQFESAWQVGAEEAQRAITEGNVVLIAGEMGIGNTTAAACLTMLLAGETAQAAVGRGAGADDATLGIKQAIVAAAVERISSLAAQDMRAAIAAISGFEIVAMAGFFAEGARHGATLLLDGYVATAAALIAERLHPGTVNCMIAAHQSAEPGHRAALAYLGLEPLLDWSMRLGEGTGALVALPLLDSAAALLRDVAALSDLGVARED
jgi:nicotinate-nucleotide--dimethylbenzimidazole phosphoribosyltransferase